MSKLGLPILSLPLLRLLRSATRPRLSHPGDPRVVLRAALCRRDPALRSKLRRRARRGPFRYQINRQLAGSAQKFPRPFNGRMRLWYRAQCQISLGYHPAQGLHVDVCGMARHA